MDLLEAWTTTAEDGEGEVGTYVDAMGNEQTERMAPIPFATSMREKGVSAPSLARLAAHTGQVNWAVKGQEMEALPFDDDVSRAGEGIQALSRTWTQVAVERNRQNTQPAPLNEAAQVGRDGLYHGHNSLYRPNPHMIPTRRSVQPLETTGHIHAVAHLRRGRVASNASHVKKAGLVEADTTGDGGRRADESRKAPKSTQVLRANGAFSSLLPTSKAADVAPQRPVHSMHFNTHRTAAVVPQTERVTAVETQYGHVAPQIHVSDARNDVHRVRQHGGGATGESTVEGARPDAVFGTADSHHAADPRKLTFEQMAAVAATVALGTQDSRATRDAPAAPEYRVPARAGDVAAQWAMGPVAGRDPVRTDAQEARTLTLPTRPALRNDSTAVRRVVHDRSETSVAPLTGSHARQWRAERSAVPAALPTYEEKAALTAGRVLSVHDAADVSVASQRARHRDTWTATLKAAVTRVANASRDGMAGRTGNQTQATPTASVAANLPRDLRDDGTVMQRATPLFTGPMRVSDTTRLPPLRSHGRETPTPESRATYRDVRAPLTSFEHIGTRVG